MVRVPALRQVTAAAAGRVALRGRAVPGRARGAVWTAVRSVSATAAQHVPDHPGTVGALASLRQGVSVVCAVHESKAVAVTCTDFTVAGLGDEADGMLGPEAESPLAVGATRWAVSSRRCVSTLPFALPQGALAAVHVLDGDGHGIGYHFLSPRRVEGSLRDHLHNALQGVQSGRWPASAFGEVDATGDGTDVPEVPNWRCCLLCRVLTTASLTPRQHVTLLQVVKVVAGEKSAAADPFKPALFVCPWQAREELLVEAFRKRVLLPADWDHEARVILCWWYARKFGRDQALPLLRAGVRGMLRAQGQEHLFNATTDAAVLHLVAHAIYARGHLASYADFAVACPDIANDPELLHRYYSPQLLASRAARVAAVPPDRESFPGGAPLSSSIRKTLREDSPIIPALEGDPTTLRDRARAGLVDVAPVKSPSDVPPDFDRLRVIPPGMKTERSPWEAPNERIFGYKRTPHLLNRRGREGSG
eukprot:TRINITY_DN28758_c0_g1_i1.p1 TRINITY_DN28758_c0_g1~~TRINITY_DN28758_c0_g1_i1.p1  ORF type:complete len:477 (+),score=120.58 TRINITY_DN28758_c0_g1_i1:69-1499(+)